MNNNQHSNVNDRYPAVAGSFYPADENSLLNSLSQAFSQALPRTSQNRTIAIISPHAGYDYSAKIAASAFNQIDTLKPYKHIFIIGSSHRMAFNGASIYTSGKFITPLGKISVDSLASEIANQSNVFTTNTQAHLQEHSIEVQLPFLQYKLKYAYSIIPILLGTQSAETCKKIAKALKPYFTTENLFIVSTDFSHYPGYSNAVYSDSVLAESITTNSPKNVLDAIQKVETKEIPGLLTTMCGWTSVLTLMYLAENNSGISVQKIDYQNSGDTKYGDTSKVVGYNAIRFSIKLDNEINFSLNASEKATLLKFARNAIKQKLFSGVEKNFTDEELTEKLKMKTGAFVTITKNGELRGCIGTFKATQPLYKVVQEMALSAAFGDTRFTPLQKEEFDEIELEISVLTPLKPITSPSEIEIGKHGIYMVKGNSTGTLLPQVPQRYGWNTEEFLGHCARDKAYIGWNGWKEAQVYTYEALVFSEKTEN